MCMSRPPLRTRLSPSCRSSRRGQGLPGIPADKLYSFFVPGLLIQLGLFGAAFVGFAIISDWRFGVIERFRVTPASRRGYAAGTSVFSGK